MSQDVLTELFARAVVVHRRAKTLLELLENNDTPVGDVRDVIAKLSGYTSEMVRIIGNVDADGRSR